MKYIVITLKIRVLYVSKIKKIVLSLNMKGKDSNNIFGYIFARRKGRDILTFEEYILNVWSF
jgi:hypothetical protein